jgi:hypothetical protein
VPRPESGKPFDSGLVARAWNHLHAMIVQLHMSFPLAGLLLFQIALISPNAAPTSGDLLPAELGEWHAAAPPQKFSAAQVGDFAGDASAALDEFGFFGGQRREYQQGNRTITVEAMRMKDSSAAYGAYTFYRQPGWREESNAAHDPRSFEAAVGPNEAVLQRNSYCVRFIFDSKQFDSKQSDSRQGAAPTHKELALAAAMLPSMQNEPLPVLPSHLPVAGLVAGSPKYAYGPKVFAQIVPQVPAMAVGFYMGAEAMSAEYRMPGKPSMNLVLIEYPTPQIARNIVKNLDALNLTEVRMKRIGPLLVIVPNVPVNSPLEADAQRLIGQVHYEMAGMWDEKTPNFKEPTFAQMIMSIFELCGILLVFCLLSGLVYGGILALTRSRSKGHGFEGNADFISLDLNS